MATLKKTNKQNQVQNNENKFWEHTYIAGALSILRFPMIQHPLRITADITAHTFESSLITAARNYGLPEEASHLIERSLIIILWILLIHWVIEALRDLVKFICEMFLPKKPKKAIHIF